MYKIKKLSCCFITAFVIMTMASSFFQRAAADSTVSNAATDPKITAETAIVVDAQSGQIYYDKDMHKHMYPASITKILTGLVAAENGNPNDVITVGSDVLGCESSGVANIALNPGEQITQDQALYTMFLASANDSAVALADHIGGSVENFVSLMNKRAGQLGAVDSNFSNPNGLPDANNYTSAFDMALISRQAYLNTDLMKYFGATSYTLPANNMRKKPEAFSTLHKMMKKTKYYYSGVIAGKTGWETMSGHTLVTVAQRNGRTLICIVMKSEDGNAVYTDTTTLLNYAFSKPYDAAAATILTNKGSSALSTAGIGAPASTDNNESLQKNQSVKNNNFILDFIIALTAISGLLGIAFMSVKMLGKQRKADM